jgi:hypothetical protein
MTHTRISGLLSEVAARTITSSRIIAVVMIVTFTSLAMQSAHAQSADTWKSVAIIGGSTAAGAYIGHKVAGPTGTWIGAGIGASAGYAIDSRRRANEYYSQSGYGDTGYYDANGGYNGNSGYYGGPYDGSALPYRSNNHSAETSRRFK